jgi:hypothetical protein
MARFSGLSWEKNRIRQQQRRVQAMLPVHQLARDQALFSGTAGAVGVPGTGSSMERRKSRKARVRYSAEFEVCAAARRFGAPSGLCCRYSLLRFVSFSFSSCVTPKSSTSSKQKSHQDVCEGRGQKKGISWDYEQVRPETQDQRFLGCVQLLIWRGSGAWQVLYGRVAKLYPS